MNIVYDARHIGEPYTGLGRYSGSLVEALLRTHDHPATNLVVMLQHGVEWQHNPYFTAIEQASKTGRCIIEYVDSRPISLSQHVVVSRWLNQRKPDLYFYPHFDAPLLTDVPTTFVVHDLIPLKIDNYVRHLAPLKKQYFKQMIHLNLRRQRTCVTDSRATLRDIVTMYPPRHCKNIRTCYLGVDTKPDAQHAPRPLDAPYILYVGDRRPHKNIRYTIDVFKRLVDQHGYQGKLVLVGTKVNHDFDVESYVAQMPQVVIIGNVADNVLEQFYRHTDALVFLSKYEGFGLPVIEAGKWGRKIVVSDGGSLPEIAPEGSCIIPLSNTISEAARMMAQYLASDLHPDGDFVTRTYTWENAAKAIFPLAYQQ